MLSEILNVDWLSGEGLESEPGDKRDGLREEGKAQTKSPQTIKYEMFVWALQTQQNLTDRVLDVDQMLDRASLHHSGKTLDELKHQAQAAVTEPFAPEVSKQLI